MNAGAKASVSLAISSFSAGNTSHSIMAAERNHRKYLQGHSRSLDQGWKIAESVFCSAHNFWVPMQRRDMELVSFATGASPKEILLRNNRNGDLHARKTHVEPKIGTFFRQGSSAKLANSQPRFARKPILAEQRGKQLDRQRKQGSFPLLCL